jgi:peptidoglycan/xylan/chitin deacetylase (PgdA/CDA1 family)
MNKKALIKILEVSGLLSLSRFLNRHRPMILMYHRILREPLVPGIPPEIFAQQLEYLQKKFRVIPISQLVKELEAKTLKPYSVAITFDDGHEDFYNNAWPILKRYGLPASIYITTGFVDKKHWLWPDLLRFILMNTKHSLVEVTGVGQLLLNEQHLLTSWNALGDYCLGLDAASRRTFLIGLASQLEVAIPPEPQAPFSPLNWTQLNEMHHEGLDVGSHTVSHPILSTLNEEDLMRELADSRQRIQEEIGEAPIGICYPNGMAKDISTNVEEKAKQFYKYGLVAYAADIQANKIMHIGRWGAADNMLRFKQVMCGFSHNDNHLGEYR